MRGGRRCARACPAFLPRVLAPLPDRSPLTRAPPQVLMACMKPMIFILSALAALLPSMGGFFGSYMMLTQMGMMGANIMHQTAPMQQAALGLVKFVSVTALRVLKIIPTPPSLPKINLPRLPGGVFPGAVQTVCDDILKSCGKRWVGSKLRRVRRCHRYTWRARPLPSSSVLKPSTSTLRFR